MLRQGNACIEILQLFARFYMETELDERQWMRIYKLIIGTLPLYSPSEPCRRREALIRVYMG
eukprot:8890569-Alexandrium_andersonii.AAC.1